MDQDMSSNPPVQASDTPASSDTSMTNPAAAFAPEVPSNSDATTLASDSPVVTPDPTIPPATVSEPASSEVQSEVIKKISDAQNVLVALSSDPSVDEMSAAIGLSLFLDKLGKRATAIYSGTTPNALEFLKPEDTFEHTADTLQDFVIALNKDKADHLRYKLDGDYVKIFITPYKARISEEDLEFSYGDFNVDLVLALDVANGIDLDSALREHGRIMHDAVIINITTGNPGRFGEIEWSDKSASSVSEMIAKLLYSVGGDVKIDKDEATAFLTGIVAATNRFSNAKTTPETMQISSRLMQSGANQQLISKNITPDVDNEIYSIFGSSKPKEENDPTKLDIEHDDKADAHSPKAETQEKEISSGVGPASSLLDDLKAAEASLSTAGSETVPDDSHQPVKLNDTSADTAKVETELNSAPPEPGELSESLGSIEPPAPPVIESEPTEAPINEPPVVSPSSTDLTTEPTKPVESVEPSEPAPTLPPVMPPADFAAEPASSEPSAEPNTESDAEPIESNSSEEGIIGSDKPEKVIQPSPDMDLSAPDEGSEKYGKMLENAVAGLESSPTAPIVSNDMPDNPASMMSPQVATAPEINGVPEMNYMPMPGEEVLPPPPTPPIDMNSTAPAMPAFSDASADMATPIEPAVPPVEPSPTPLGAQPSMQDQVYAPQAADPGAFKIPGM